MLTATLWVALGVITAAFIARGVKVSEFRQAWIDGLRNDVSEYICKSHQWIDLYLVINGETVQNEKNKLFPKLEQLKYDALHIHNRISLRFKPEDTSGNELLKNLLNLVDPGSIDIENNAHSNWRDLSDSVVMEARMLLKQEWEATKNPLLKYYPEAKYKLK